MNETSAKMHKKNKSLATGSTDEHRFGSPQKCKKTQNILPLRTPLRPSGYAGQAAEIAGFSLPQIPRPLHSLVFSAEAMLQTRLSACLPPSTTRANRSFVKPCKEHGFCSLRVGRREYLVDRRCIRRRQETEYRMQEE